MFLVVGLGNPGLQYRETRHNVGFTAVNLLCNMHETCWNTSTRFYAKITSTYTQFGEKVIICKPYTFMNRSSTAVSAITSFYNITSDKIIVIHDDIDIKLGKIKYKIGGSAGGHRGIKSIDNTVGVNYHRIRIGVGRPHNKNCNIADFVLSKFTPQEREIVIDTIHRALETMPLLYDSTEAFKKTITSI